MNVQLIVAGALAIGAAAFHGWGGEMLVARNLRAEGLPPSAFGGRALTKMMIRVSWHIATLAFLLVGVMLVLAGSVLGNGTARAVALLAAGAATSFAALVLAAAFTRRRFFAHPAPVGLSAVAVLACWGASITS